MAHRMKHVLAASAAMIDVRRRLAPRSEMAKALNYGAKRWPALSQFLDDGRLEIDNNMAERALRGVAPGRRNWLFAGSKAGGEPAATIYTVIDRKVQRRRAAGLYRRRRRKARERLACLPLGRTHALELDPAVRRRSLKPPEPRPPDRAYADEGRDPG